MERQEENMNFLNKMERKFGKYAIPPCPLKVCPHRIVKHQHYDCEQVKA